MIHPLVLSWLTMMITVAYALRSPIHSPLVAGLMNLGRDAIVLVVAQVKFTTHHLLHLHLIDQHSNQLISQLINQLINQHSNPKLLVLQPKLPVLQPKLLVLQLELPVLQRKLPVLPHFPPLRPDIVQHTQRQTLTTTPKTMISVQSQHARVIPLS